MHINPSTQGEEGSEIQGQPGLHEPLTQKRKLKKKKKSHWLITWKQSGSRLGSRFQSYKATQDRTLPKK